MKSIKEIFQNINTLYLNKYNSAKLNNFTGFYFEHIYYEIAKKIFEIYTEKINVLQSKYTPKKKMSFKSITANNISPYRRHL